MKKKSELASKVFALICAPTKGVTTHTFCVNGEYLKTVEGETHFMTTTEVTKLLLMRAAEAKQMIDENA